jgi:hypothetical protein
MMHSARYLFCPEYDYRQIVQITQAKVLADAAEWMNGADPDALSRQVEVLSGFLTDPGRSQFIDFDRHPFMRESPRAGVARVAGA